MKTIIGKSTAAELRRRAEHELAERQSKPSTSPSADDTQRLIHELQVHQIELEMQNEELQEARVDTEAALAKYSDLYDFAPTGYLTLTVDGTILAANLAGANLVGLERASLVHRRLAFLISEADRPAFHLFLQKTFTSTTRESCDVSLKRDGAPPAFVRFEAVASANGRECRAAILDVTERRQAAHERERLIAELTQALANVKMLTGLLPICAGCKKIRDGEGSWTQIETYISHRSEANFSHGICPDCLTKFYPEQSKRVRPRDE